jgi:hypothetical protein
MVHATHAPTPGAHDEPDRPHRTDAGTSPDPRDAMPGPVADLTETLDAEHMLIRRIVLGIVIAVPIAVAVVLGMVLIALGSDDVRWEAPILVAVALGTLAGVFFGAWAGFVSTAHAFEEIDAHHRPAGDGTPAVGA